MVYADYMASGRGLKFIEDYIQNQVMPMYANTHSLQLRTGRQTNSAREDARAVIKRCHGANDKDICIFSCNGSTSAINLLIQKLHIKAISEQVQKQERPLTQ